MRFLKSLAVLATVLSLALPAAAQDRMKAEEVVVAFAAEPRTLLPNTIVDWTTNNMVEHMYDRLVDRDPKTYKPVPMLATGWKIVNTSAIVSSSARPPAATVCADVARNEVTFSAAVSVCCSSG